MFPLLVNDAVPELCELGSVPAVGGSYKVTGDTLESVDVVTSAMRTDFEIFGRILEAAVKTAVSVVVHRAVAKIILVHKVYD